jgi:hypothetical protein
MTGWRARVLRWSIVLSLAAGLVAMHSLLIAGGGGVGHPSRTARAAMSEVSVSHSPAHAAVGAASEVGQVPAAEAPSRPPGHHGDGMSMLLHLCLAVLGALLLALAVPLLLAVLARAAPAGRTTGLPAPCAHPRAPPPTPVRLAQLCVSRR